MPYKERAKFGLPRKRPKSPYKVTNWTAYNRSLIHRGRVSFYFPGGNVRAAFVNEIEYVEGLSGKQVRYLDPYIETLFMLKIVFREFELSVGQVEELLDHQQTDHQFGGVRRPAAKVAMQPWQCAVDGGRQRGKVNMTPEWLQRVT